MPAFKKNQMNQIMFPMVDKTDFASIESGITASDFNSAATKKFFGVEHGVSTLFTSGSISKAASLVRSGIFQQTLKASECNYDYLIVSFRHPSCADQILIFQPMEVDPSDAYSLLSDFLSDFQSRVPKAVATNSQLSDLHSDLRSFLVVMSGVQSDIYSGLSDLHSDFQSRVPKAVATQSLLSDVESNLRSFLVVMSGVQSDIYSGLSDLHSDFQSRVPKRVATDSQLSDLHSDLRSFLVVMSGVQSDIYSGLSDLHSDFQSRVPKRVATDSQLSDVHSDLKSAIAGITVTISASDVSDIASAVLAGLTGLTASDISDVASAVNAILASRLSDILSAAVQTNSRALVIQSMTSDVYSLLSDTQSDFQSRVPKRVATDSQLSDLHSDLRSFLVVMSGIQSDILSMLSDANSDLRSLVIAGVGVNASAISDIESALASRLSDILSAAQQTNSRVLINQSRVSDIYSLLSDVQSDLLSHLDTTGVGLNTSTMSDIRSAIAGITVTLSASDISDIASAVVAAGTGLTVSNISDIASAVVRALSGVGAKEVIIEVKDNGVALDGVDVWVTTDITGLSIVQRGFTNALGQVTFFLDPGNYYIWKQLSGYTFTNPELKTVNP